MNSILKQLQELADADLYALSEVVDVEMQRRAEVSGESPESARRRAVEREQSYRRRNGAAAPPVRTVGIGKAPRRRAA